MTVEQRLHDLEEQLASQKLVMDTLLQNLLSPALMVPGTLRFGGNVMELGNNGVQILSKATGKNAVFFFDDKFQVDPNSPTNPTGTPYSVLIGYVSRSGSPPGSQISMDAVAGTATGELTVTASNDTNDEAVTQSYVNVGSDLATVRHEMSGGRTFAQLLLSNTVLRLASFTSDPSTLGDGDIWYRSDLDKVYLRANGATVELSTGSGGMSLIVKTADETVNGSATLQNDDELLFAVAANETWQFEGVLFYTSGATPDIKITATGPSGAVGRFGVVATSSNLSVEGRNDELGTGVTITSPAGNPGIVHFYGAIANGANAGNLTLQWAQGTSDASDTIVHAGSYIKYQEQV